MFKVSGEAESIAWTMVLSCEAVASASHDNTIVHQSLSDDARPAIPLAAGCPRNRYLTSVD